MYVFYVKKKNQTDKWEKKQFSLWGQKKKTFSQALFAVIPLVAY